MSRDGGQEREEEGDEKGIESDRNLWRPTCTAQLAIRMLGL